MASALTLFTVATLEGWNEVLYEGEAIQASMTVTLAAPKIPLILPPAESRARLRSTGIACKRWLKRPSA